VIRSELEARVDNPATDLVPLRLGSTITIESNGLRVQAKIADLTPGTVPTLPFNSHFEGLTIQMQGWQKTAVGVFAAAPPVPAAAGLPDLSSYEIGPPPEMPSVTRAPRPPAPGGLPDLSSYEMGPPPEMPSGVTRPSPAVGSPRPLSPPPLGQPPAASPGMRPSRPQQDDEDPFGGTGDFTPLGR
jgi:hypothetical protein